MRLLYLLALSMTISSYNFDLIIIEMWGDSLDGAVTFNKEYPAIIKFIGKIL